MISKGELNVFLFIVSLESVLSFLPIERGSSRYHLQFTTKKYKWPLYYALKLFSMSYFIFALVRFYPAYHGYRTLYPVHYTLFHFAYLLLHIFTVMFDTVFTWYGVEIIELYNQLIGFNITTG